VWVVVNVVVRCVVWASLRPGRFLSVVAGLRVGGCGFNNSLLAFVVCKVYD
jgi:hypothetical protein